MVSGDVPITSFFSRKPTGNADSGSVKKRRARALSTTSSQSFDDSETASLASGSSTRKNVPNKNKRHKPPADAQPTARKTKATAPSSVLNAVASSSSTKRRKHMSSPIHEVKKEEQAEVIDLTDSPRRSARRRPRPNTPVPTSYSPSQPPPSSAVPSTSSTAPRPSRSTSPPTSPVDSPQVSRRPRRHQFKLPALPLSGRMATTMEDESPPGYHEYEDFVPSSQTQPLYTSPMRSNSTRSVAPMRDGSPEELVPSSQSQSQPLSFSPKRIRPISAPGTRQETQFVPSSQTQELEIFPGAVGPSRQRSEKPQSYSLDNSFVPSSQPTLDGVHDFDWNLPPRGNKPESSIGRSSRTHTQKRSNSHDRLQDDDDLYGDDDEYHDDEGPNERGPSSILQCQGAIRRCDSPEPISERDSPEPTTRNHINARNHSNTRNHTSTQNRTSTQDSDHGQTHPSSSLDRFQYDEHDRPETLLSDTQLDRPWTQASELDSPARFRTQRRDVDSPSRYRTQRPYAESPSRPRNTGRPGLTQRSPKTPRRSQRESSSSQRKPTSTSANPVASGSKPTPVGFKSGPADSGSETESEEEGERLIPVRGRLVAAGSASSVAGVGSAGGAGAGAGGGASPGAASSVGAASSSKAGPSHRVRQPSSPSRVENQHASTSSNARQDNTTADHDARQQALDSQDGSPGGQDDGHQGEGDDDDEEGGRGRVPICVPRQLRLWLVRGRVVGDVAGHREEFPGYVL
ncbi:hypothetical protein BDV98DRAFT_570119, partial [Pterulicium gracile]